MALLGPYVEVNGYGPIYLYQAVYPLLKKSKKPTFVGVGSPIGTATKLTNSSFSKWILRTIQCRMALLGPYAAHGYGRCSVRKIHFENEEFVSFVADPG
jgi:norsolorinic acid ketoreductase